MFATLYANGVVVSEDDSTYFATFFVDFSAFGIVGLVVSVICLAVILVLILVLSRPRTR